MGLFRESGFRAFAASSSATQTRGCWMPDQVRQEGWWWGVFHNLALFRDLADFQMRRSGFVSGFCVFGQSGFVSVNLGSFRDFDVFSPKASIDRRETPAIIGRNDGRSIARYRVDGRPGRSPQKLYRLLRLVRHLREQFGETGAAGAADATFGHQPGDEP